MGWLELWLGKAKQALALHWEGRALSNTQWRNQKKKAKRAKAANDALGPTSNSKTTSGKSGRNRVLSELSTPSPLTSAKKTKEKKLSATYAHVIVRNTRLAIVKFDFPVAKLSLEEALVIMRCSNEDIVSWVRKSFQAYNSAIEYATLKVLGMKDMPKLVKVANRIRDIVTESYKVLLKRIKMMNPELRSGWCC